MELIERINNAEKYFFSDFTHTGYERLLETAKKKWTFRNYTNFNKDERFILWRHDVDYSMHAARNLALLEHKHGISATYFLLPHSELYNLFEKEITDLVKFILSLGHQIGLHFDTHYYGITEVDQLEKYLLREKRWLEETFEKEINVFSFHNTTPFTMSCKARHYAGMINTYAEFFQSRVEYCSDSNGIWRFKRLKDVLEQSESNAMQILTHPEWWQKEVLSPRQRIQRCVEGRSLKHITSYNNLLATNNRPNIDWHE